MTQRELMMLVAEAVGFAVANRNDGEKIDLAAIVDRILAEHEGMNGHISSSVIPTGEQLYVMVTSRFKNGSFPWDMVGDSGREAWNLAASDLLLSPDTILYQFSLAKFQK